MICLLLLLLHTESQYEHHDFISPTAEPIAMNKFNELADAETDTDSGETDSGENVDESSNSEVSFLPEVTFSIEANQTAADFNVTYTVTYLFSLTESQTMKDGEESNTVLITYMLQKTALTPEPVKNATATPTATMALKTEFFHPAVIIGATSILLFIIGAIYTACCRKTARINYGALLKAQKRKGQVDDDSSSSLEEVKPKKNKKASKPPTKAPAKSTRSGPPKSSKQPARGGKGGKSTRPKK